MEKEKEITISGVRFKILKMPAKLACWIFTVGTGMLTGRASQEDFEKIQDHLLRHCQRLDTSTNLPVAILGPDGKLDKEIADNAPAVMRLTMEAFKFNTDPFVSALEDLAANAENVSAPTT